MYYNYIINFVFFLPKANKNVPFFTEMIMQANFLLERELVKELEYGKDPSPNFMVHFHSHIEIYLIHSGEVEVLINGQRKKLHAGEISVAFSYDAHGYRTVGDADTEYLIIPTSYCAEIQPFLSGKRMNSPFISDPKTYEIVSECMAKLRSGLHEISKRGYVYEILGAILDHALQDSESGGPSPGFSAEVLIYISEHFREEITLSEVAKTFGYHPSYLSRIFRQTFGISFGGYLTMLRLRETVLLLRKGNKNITTCALESGFGSMRSFYRAFHDEFGCTPKEYFDLDHKEGQASPDTESSI